MSFLKDRLTAEFAGHRIDVRADNHLVRGLVYKLFLDDAELAEAQNFLKLPTTRTIEVRVAIEGVERHIVLQVSQRILRSEFELRIDGELVPLTHVE